MRTRAVVAAIASALVTAVLLSPTAAEARGGVTVRNDQGKAEADTTYSTTITVAGSGFQSIKGGHGGIYVFFGSVNGRWQPSKGGQTGRNMFYVPDSESKNNDGFQRFVTFPGNKQTGESANGGSISSSGAWSTTVTVPAATFQAVDRQGKAQTINCRKVQCGVITIGAHGVKNANNETFTPIEFVDLYDEDPVASPSSKADTAAPAAGTPTQVPAATPGMTPEVEPAKKGQPKVSVDSATAVAGRVLSFSGLGFSPGEQVTATLDDGRAAVGPLGAGPSGEIAGVLQLPADLKAGTHVLRLSGAGSGAQPSVNFPITAPAATKAKTVTDDSDEWRPWAFLGLALVALVGSLIVAAVQIKSIRRKRRKGAIHV